MATISVQPSLRQICSASLTVGGVPVPRQQKAKVELTTASGVLKVISDSDDSVEELSSWSNPNSPPPKPNSGAGKGKASRPRPPRAPRTPAAGSTAQRNIPTGILIETGKECYIDADQRANGLGDAVYCSMDARKHMHRRVAKVEFCWSLGRIRSRRTAPTMAISTCSDTEACLRRR